MTLTTGRLSITSPLSLFLPLLLLLSPSQGVQEQPPHIVIIMVDDLGFNDLGFRDPQMVTPNIDKLAEKSVILDRAYMLKSCTPSRSSFLTGVYAYRMALQDTSLHAANNYSIPLDKKLFPEELKENGYSTHFVGKWHLGFCKPEMTPTRRGFDTFYGMYNGGADYYTHLSKWEGYDLQDDNATHYGTDWSANMTYSSDAFSDRAVKIINDHDKSKPLFLFLSYQAVHGPLQYPQRFYDVDCANVTYKDDKRRQHCALTAAMDEGIGRVSKALKESGLDDNLITLFTSDNGGPFKCGSSNWPLRGAKTIEWEGGTRVISFLHSKKYLPKPFTWKGLIHAVDWYPTLLSMAGIKTNNTDINGMDNWDRILKNQTSKRTEFVYNYNEVLQNFAFRWMQYKAVKFANSKPHDWFFPPPGEQPISVRKPNFEEWLLFDVIQDPSETVNIASKEECIQKDLVRQLERYRKKGHLPVFELPKLEAAHPMYHNGTWTTGWC